jgi:hypothetical protein
MDPLPFVLSGMMILGYLALPVLSSVPPVPYALLGCAFLGIVVCCYLTGPAASLTVLPDKVIVKNAFVRYDIPRKLIQNMVEFEGLSLKLDVGTRRITIGAWEPALVASTNRSRSASAARTRRVAALFDSVPAIISTENEVETRWRAWNIALAVTPALSFAAVLVLKSAFVT